MRTVIPPRSPAHLYIVPSPPDAMGEGRPSEEQSAPSADTLPAVRGDSQGLPLALAREFERVAHALLSHIPHPPSGRIVRVEPLTPTDDGAAPSGDLYILHIACLP